MPVTVMVAVEASEVGLMGACVVAVALERAAAIRARVVVA